MTDTSGGFSFPDAAERRAFMDRVGRGIGRYIPPEMRPLLGFVAESTPSAALERAGAASMEMVAPDRTASERLGSLGAMLSETASVAAPMVAAPRAAIPASEALQEALLGASVGARTAGQGFMERMNRPGDVPVMYSGFDPEAIIRALREGVPAAEARLADDMRIGNERIRAEALARTGEIPSVTPPARYAEFLNQRGFSPDFQELVLGPMGDRFDTVRHIFDEDTDFALDSLRNVAGERAGPEQLASTRSQVTRLTQELLRDFPEEITVYRAGRVVPGQPQSFTLDPNYDVSGNLPWRQGTDAPLEAYTVRKSDILASPDITRRGAIGEGEVIIRGDNVSRIAARGPREFAQGGEVMMRSDMSSQLSGGIGGFAGDAKNMFRGPRGIERFARYMQAGGEAVSLNRAQPSVTELTNSLYETGRPELFTQYEDEYFVNSPLGYAAFYEGEPFPGEAAKWAQPTGPMEELLRGVRRETGAADRVQGSGNEQNVMDLVQLYDFLQRKPASDLTASEQRLLEEIPVYLSRTTGMNEGGEVREREDERRLPSIYERIMDDRYWISTSPGVRDAATTMEDKLDLMKLMGFVQTAQDGGEITARGLGASQGSTTGSAVAGPGRDVYTGFEGDRLSAVRTRIIREAGVDPVQIAAEEGLDPNLFLNMIAQESGGNARAESDAGAYGYTQLMDETARELGVDRTDPEQNLRGGARYLRQQIDTFQDIPLALAAYNAGPNAVRRFGGIPPYAETRQYVANILGLPGGQQAVSPTMRPGAVMPVPRPAEQDRGIVGLVPQRNPLNELGEILVSRPANQIPQALLPQLDQTVNASIMPDQLGGFSDLMRTMP